MLILNDASFIIYLFLDTLNSLHHHIIFGTTSAVSDESFDPSRHIGACACIVSTPDIKEWIRGGCGIPGLLSIHSAYIVELGGLTDISFLFITVILHQSATIHQYVISDFKSVLNRLTTAPEYVKTSLQYMDGIIATLPIFPHAW